MSKTSTSLPRKQRRLLGTLALLLIASSLQACAVYTAADTAVSVVGTGVKTTAKVVGGAASLAVDALTPSQKKAKKAEAFDRICEKNPDYHECQNLSD